MTPRASFSEGNDHRPRAAALHKYLVKDKFGPISFSRRNFSLSLLRPLMANCFYIFVCDEIFMKFGQGKKNLVALLNVQVFFGLVFIVEHHLVGIDLVPVYAS